MKLGDAVATVAKPIARGIDYAFGTDLENCQSCHGPGGRQARLNRLSDDVIDFFAKRLILLEGKPMEKLQFIVTRTKQTLVEAETPEKAEEAEAQGQGQLMSTSRTVQPRPQQPQQQQSKPAR
jgi:hypothetical protein